MRPRAPAGPASATEQVARGSPALAALTPPPGMSPLRMRLLRLCLSDQGMACPDKLDGLRRMSLREALEMEDVAHYRQREALLLQDALKDASARDAARQAAIGGAGV